MKAAIENFAAMKGNKKVLLLGSMMELGADSIKEHSEIMSLIDQNQWEAVVLVGKEFKSVNHKYINFDDALQARAWLKKKNFENVQMLIKGSRSMQMEKVLE
jgi:UDP-N-acetylmuramoyl-tripeptide--D-alanyl-D-alanine ligase